MKVSYFVQTSWNVWHGASHFMHGVVNVISILGNERSLLEYGIESYKLCKPFDTWYIIKGTYLLNSDITALMVA